MAMAASETTLKRTKKYKNNIESSYKDNDHDKRQTHKWEW